MKVRLTMLVAAMAAVLIGCLNGVGPSGSPVPEASGTAAAEAIPEAIVGSWTSTITTDDLRAGGLTDEGTLAENVGTFTQTFGADGTWSTSQEADVPLKWPVFRGTMAATGPDSFRQTTTFPADFAGDVVDFTWSIEDGALVLHVVNPPDPVLPIITESHPWQPKE